MAIDLLKSLLKFRGDDDRENEVAFFRTHVPWIAPEAYLHIVFKPASPDGLSDSAKRIRIPAVIVEFLSKQNGAILFSNALSIWGVVRTGTLLTRKDVFSLPPFNIEQENSELRHLDQERYLAIGNYGFDGSYVCIDRSNDRISLFPRHNDVAVASWRDLEHWINTEITRLSLLFDNRGKRLVDESQTVPPPECRVM